ncbi:hypothetical protein BGX31_011333 [Mortierella sp. GBA43]|nr:hypothetical protein BGX31_011333 [Mortierella sp. GBA43]
MTDSAVHQQSKRLAGLSITNSSGNKVSILNDTPLDMDKASIKSEREYDSRAPPSIQIGGNGHPPPPPPPPQAAEYGRPPLRSPRSPHYRDHHRRDYFDDRKDPYHYPASPSTSFPYRQRSESYEQGRSTSLTNAATPFRSGFDARASEINSQRNEHESSSPTAYRGMMAGHPGLPEGILTGPSLSKRKYSCTHPGCNKRFTTSGHLARHNRIHTGERNFSCLMPGCPSKFSRQDNMMQHYRTHISPKSRRGTNAKKPDQLDGENAGENGGADGELSGAGEQEPESMDQDDEVSPTIQTSNNGFAARDQQQQQQHHGYNHHSPSSQQERNWSAPSSPTSPMSRAGDRMEDVMTTSTAPSTSSSMSGSSSTSSSSHRDQRDQQLFYYRQQQQYQQQYQQRQVQKHHQQQAASHASAYYHAAAATTTQASSSPHSSNRHSHGHSHSYGHGSKHLASPPSSYPHSHMHLSTSSSSGSRGMGSSSNGRGAMTPPSPQSTPVTPTKYRFDPIQDCLQQERRQREEATL